MKDIHVLRLQRNSSTLNMPRFRYTHCRTWVSLLASEKWTALPMLSSVKTLPTVLVHISRVWASFTSRPLDGRILSHDKSIVSAVTLILWDILMFSEHEWKIIQMHVSDRYSVRKLSFYAGYLFSRYGLGVMFLLITSGERSAVLFGVCTVIDYR